MTSADQSAAASGTPGQVPTPPPTHALPELQIRTFIPASFCPGQHGSPGPPHASQVPAPPPAQVVLGAVHVLFAQQTLPTVPHVSQVRVAPIAPAHTNAAPLQVTLAQQG
jgi:hypothetical protein